MSGLPESTLRYYETIGLIDPVGRDLNTGHRVYGEDDINLLVSIACLNATGMCIEDMRTYLSNRGLGTSSAKEQIALLEAQQRRLIDEARNLKLRRQYIDAKIAYWRAVASGKSKAAEIIAKNARKIAKALRLPKEGRERT